MTHAIPKSFVEGIEANLGILADLLEERSHPQMVTVRLMSRGVIEMAVQFERLQELEMAAGDLVRNMTAEMTLYIPDRMLRYFGTPDIRSGLAAPTRAPKNNVSSTPADRPPPAADAASD